MPMSSSFVRIDRIASSSSRAISSGHQSAAAASICAIVVGCSPPARRMVKVAVRFARSISTVTWR
jgi:ABC-type nitrate/sulfonate/bicarbonate transport system permease component